MTQCVLPGTSTSHGFGGISKKRSGDEIILSPPKRMRYIYRLESESSRNSADDTETTESILSIQGYETELVGDTTDTLTKSEYSDSDSELDLSIEYEVRSSSEGDEEPPIGNINESSEGTDEMLTAVGAIAAVICEPALEHWVTDGEDSDNSTSTEIEEPNRIGFGKCLQCKSNNDNPSFRYCKKCFQVRKSFFPPRPRGYKRKEKKPVDVPHDKNSFAGSDSKQEIFISSNESLKQPIINSLSGQDSGIGSSQSLILESNSFTSTSTVNIEDIKSENSTSIDSSEHVSSISNKSTSKTESSEDKDLCMICNVETKNSIFLHGAIAHMCCCYKCAMKSWVLHRKCPACNRKASNVVKVFVL